MKNKYAVHNPQGAFLMYVYAKDEKNAIRQAKKTWSGPITVTKAG